MTKLPRRIPGRALEAVRIAYPPRPLDIRITAARKEKS